MIFYETVVALNREQHLTSKIQSTPGNFAFSSKANSVLLAHTEFVEAARDYPIVFVGQAGGTFAASALLGLQTDQNLMVDAQGTWAQGAYVPAFVRRYPFILATDDDAQAFTVCLDAACIADGVDAGESLFQADGTETPYLQERIAFLRLFHTEMEQTQSLVSKLAALQLLSPKVITVEQGGQTIHLDGLWVVDEQKLMALEDAAALELFRSGSMGLIYTHLTSLRNVARLAQRQGAAQST